MIDELAKNLVSLKNEFAKIYDGKSQIQEVIPISKSNFFQIPQKVCNLKILWKNQKMKLKLMQNCMKNYVKQ